MKKSEIDSYLRNELGLANRPTHNDVRDAMKFAYNLGSKDYKKKLKNYKDEANLLSKIISEQHNTNKAVAHLITSLQSEISKLKNKLNNFNNFY